MKAIVYAVLSFDEKTIFSYILTHKEGISQAAISKDKGISRVKVFRTIQKLQEKQLITVTVNGKERIISIHPDIKNLF